MAAPSHFLDAALNRAEAVACDMTGQGLANTFHALAKLGLKPGIPPLLRLCAAVCPGKHPLPPHAQTYEQAGTNS